MEFGSQFGKVPEIFARMPRETKVYDPKAFRKLVYKGMVLTMQDRVFSDRIGRDLSLETEIPKGFLVDHEGIIVVWDGNHRIATALLNGDYVTLELATISSEIFDSLKNSLHFYPFKNLLGQAKRMYGRRDC